MEFEVSRVEFVKVLNLISNIVSDRQTIPILSNVLLESVGKDKIHLNATDLKVSIQCNLNVNLIKSGSITIPAKRLLQIIKELPDQPIHISVNSKNQININCGNSQFKITGLPKEEYPPITFFKDTSFVLNQKEFKNMLKKVSIAVSTDTTRHILNGVYVKLHSEKLILVATDGRRLAYVEKVGTYKIDGDKSFILPGKIVQELIKILKDEKDLTMILGDKEVVFEVENIRYMSQLIDGKYPNFEQVIPKKIKHEVVLSVSDFQGAVRRSSVLVDQKLNRIKFELKEGILEISTKTPELGESKEEMSVSYSGDSIAVGFSPNYILDVLKVIGEDNVTFGLTNEGKSGLIKASPDFLYVIMPMRLV